MIFSMRRIFLLKLWPIIVIFLLHIPAPAYAQSRPFEISGWIPYWRVATGTADALHHLDTFTEINPFGYTVRNDGTLYDAAKLYPEWVATTTPLGTTTIQLPSEWTPLIEGAHAKKIRLIPTVMWSNGETMHRILSDGPKRRALEDEIAATVKENNFDGIDIDFEGKKYETREYFSTFLKGLRERLGNKWLVCTIESRTPIEDRYYGTTASPDAGLYANDFVAINKYCDRVRIMAYDQQSIDLKLNDQHKGVLYAPVADVAWVEKVMKLISKSINKNKLILGIPTYGYEYDVTAYADGYQYDLLWSFNPGYALPIAQQYGVVPASNVAGEISFSYFPTSLQPAAPLDGTTTPIIAHDQAAQAALLFASTTNSNLKFRLAWWSDAQAIASKVALAKKLGLRGVAIFKIDGGEDPDMWNVLPKYEPIQIPAGASSLTRALRVGSTGADVKLLQMILNSDPDTQVAASGPGSPGEESMKFGVLTLRAVEKFQIKYGIAKKGEAGFGSLGPRTRAKLNELIGR